MTTPSVQRRRRPAGRNHPPFPPRAALRYDVVRRILRELEPRTVAEIGCGQGALGARIAEVADYVGVEPDAESSATALSRIAPRGGRVIRGTAADLGPDATFDLVCAFEVLEHIEDDEAVLAEWVRLVRPGGHLLLSVPAFQERFGPSDTYVGHYRRYEPDALVRLLEAAGLDVVRVRLYAWPLGYALDRVRNRVDARKLARDRDRPAEELSMASGRTFQPSTRLVGAGVAAATMPFRYLQRLRPDAGTGLVALARRPG